MKKTTAQLVVEDAEGNYSGVRGKCWESFFRCQRSPVLRSQMLTVLMAGTPLESARVPAAALLDAVLVSFAARVYCGAEIVDDYPALVTRTEELWRDPAWTCRVFDSTHANAANFIMNHGSREFAAVEEQYIPGFVAWYLGHDCPAYFSEELAEVPARMLPVKEPVTKQPPPRAQRAKEFKGAAAPRRRRTK